MLLDIYSWNVNGYRAIIKKPEGKWLLENTSRADIIAIQEARVAHSSLKEAQQPSQDVWKHSLWLSCKGNQGYSGVAVFSSLDYINHTYELPQEEFSHEGRLIHVEYEHFHFLNCYFPNGQNGEERLAYKMGYYDAFLKYAQELRATKPVIAVGDYNTAHQEIDLTHPKQNMNESGFLPEERAWIDSFIAEGYIDTFRHFNPDTPEKYSWWSYKTRARERNVGWRIDYIFISEELLPNLKNAWIANDIYGSDHCPVAITLEI
ncbi:MAG: exodeoxyribonuclease III [Desulfovibrionaceae bacterium]|nr:exodeoxyribonuclease III [Desulfovibrionaceae bacterium]